MAEIDAAVALLLKDCDDAMKFGATGERAPLPLRARWRLNNAFAGQFCLRAVERLHPLIGARGVNTPDSLFLLLGATSTPPCRRPPWPGTYRR